MQKRNPAGRHGGASARRAGCLAAALLVTTCLTPLSAAAQSTWTGAVSGSYGDSGNWSPGTPGSTSTAIFGASPGTASVVLDLDGAVGSFQFNAGAPTYSFAYGGTGTNFGFQGAGIVNNSTITTPTFSLTGNKQLRFFNASTAGNAAIDLSGVSNVVVFSDTATAGTATITNGGGITAFTGNATGGQARFITNAGGTFDISSLSSGGTTAGSIAGAGNYTLGGKQLTVGSNNTSTAVSGVISGSGGSLVKTGTGTLTLSGTNLYTGGTTINGGAIAVSSAGNLGAASGGLAFGGGMFRMPGGALLLHRMQSRLPGNDSRSKAN
jgi:autotransporter-associated beta strand protein